MNNEKKFYVYGYVRLDKNTYFYIGKGTGRRYKKIDSRSDHFKNIINKTNCAVEILYDNLSEAEAFLLEEQTIEDLVFNEGYSIEISGWKRDKEKHLVNRTFGGEGASGYKHTKEALDKMSKAAKSRPNVNKGKQRTQTIKNKISNNAKLNDNYGMKGKHHTIESKIKMSESKKGIKKGPMPEETKRKISETKIGHEVEIQTRQKISNTLKGKMTGSKNGHSKAIRCIETNEIFECSRDACIKYNLQPANLCRALKNGKKIRNLTFEYITTSPATTE